MKAKQYTEDKMTTVIKEGEASAKVSDVCCKYGTSSATYYNWKSKYPGISVS